MPMNPAAPDDLPGLVAAYAQSAQALVDLAISAGEAGYDTPTDCPGWTVKDQLSHVASAEAALLGRPDPAVEVPDYAHLRHDMARRIEAGVELRRDRPGKDVAQELHRIVAARLGRLRDADLDPEQLVASPSGREIPLLQLMRMRVSDVWVHEQDVRSALGRPGNLDSPGAAVFSALALEALPEIVIDECGVPAGKVVMIELTGPVVARAGVRVEDGPDGQRVGHVMFAGGADETGPIPAIGKTTSIQLSTEAFTRRAAGRRAVADLHYTVIGDEAVAACVLEHLAITP